MRIILGLAIAATVAGNAWAGEVPTEVKVLKGQQITVHIQPFLREDELTVLRLVQTNQQALQLFVTSSSGFAAMAAAPRDGLLADGSFPATVVAIGDLPDAATAAAAALKGCEAVRQGGDACVIVLEVGPAS